MNFSTKDMILYEDADLMVINKPAGLAVHGTGKNTDETLVDILMRERPEIAGVGEPMSIVNGQMSHVIPRPGIVHRLDKDTSGCLVIAKNQKAYEFLKEQFQNRAVLKTYLAYVYGTPKEEEGVITESIGRSRGDVRRWATGRGTRGETRDARTEYKVLARYGLGEDQAKGSTEEGTFALIEAHPKTGRTHQIRVHMKHLNHPVVADNLYSPNRAQALGFTRQALHAKSISLMTPLGKRITIEAPLPADFEAARGIAESL